MSIDRSDDRTLEILYTPVPLAELLHGTPSSPSHFCAVPLIRKEVVDGMEKILAGGAIQDAHFLAQHSSQPFERRGDTGHSAAKVLKDLPWQGTMSYQRWLKGVDGDIRQPQVIGEFRVIDEPSEDKLVFDSRRSSNPLKMGLLLSPANEHDTRVRMCPDDPRHSLKEPVQARKPIQCPHEENNLLVGLDSIPCAKGVGFRTR